jgi:hypothetical protein
LCVDAWFDVLTSSTRAELVVAIAEAAFVELPLAALCLLPARNAERRLRLQLPNLSEPPRRRLRLVAQQAVGESNGDADRLSA